MRSHMYHDNYMSIKNQKYGFNFNGFNQNSTISLNLVCFMKKMNIKMTIIEVPAGQFNELIIKCTLACFMSAILELSFLVRWTNFWQSDVLKKNRKNAVSRITVHRQVYRFVYGQDEYHDASMHQWIVTPLIYTP